MKRAFLQELGITDKEVIDKILDENSSDIGKKQSELDTAIAARDDFKAQLGDVQTKLDTFADVDVEALKGEISKLQGDLSKKDDDYQSKLSEMGFNSTLSAAVNGAKGKNLKSITANLDLEALKASKNQEADIKAALEALKESDAYLFDSADSTPAKTQTPNGAKLFQPDAAKPAAQYTREDIGKMSTDEINKNWDTIKQILNQKG